MCLLKRKNLGRSSGQDRLRIVNLTMPYEGLELHVVLDNLNTHKPKRDRWLKRYPTYMCTTRRLAEYDAHSKSFTPSGPRGEKR